jgi:hypothetical protein
MALRIRSRHTSHLRPLGRPSYFEQPYPAFVSKRQSGIADLGLEALLEEQHTVGVAISRSPWTDAMTHVVLDGTAGWGLLQRGSRI